MDVAILAGPRMKIWPTHGVRVLSRLCADAGLKVGWYGGTGMKVRGVLPLEGSGAVVMVEDAQKRIHRIHAKSVVKVTPHLEFPLPFQGWYSPGLIPESTARKLMKQGSLGWQPVVVILGSGNQALKLGSELIQKKSVNRVVCVESVYPELQGWEVEKRRFEILGGKIIFGKPISLTQKTPVLWEMKIQDAHGVRIIDTARVISVGPFQTDQGFREYPSGSFLVEWENTEVEQVSAEVESYLLDEHRAVLLASRLIKGLSQKSQLEKTVWMSKQKIKELESLHDKRFTWKYEGKWLSAESKKILNEFPGTPRTLEPEKIKASIECVEVIGCRVCEKSCPAKAIKINRHSNGSTSQFLLEADCTGCGFCLQACPSQIPIMIEGDASQSFTPMIFAYTEKAPIKKGDRVGLLSRKGEMLANAKVIDQFLDGEVPLFRVEVPSHLIWEARGIISMTPKAEVESADDFYQEKGARVEVQIQGDVRRVREGQLISVALFEIGMSRPNDILICEDGSCGLCQIETDGVKKFACQTTIHQGMSIRFTRDHEPSSELCPCSSITTEQLKKTLDSIKPDSFEALAQVCDASQGRCHGLLCKKSLHQVATQSGIEEPRYADWGFPWMDWMLS